MANISLVFSGGLVNKLIIITTKKERIVAGTHSETMAFKVATEDQMISTAVPTKIPAITPHLVKRRQ